MKRFIFPVLFGGILLVATFTLMLFQQMSKDTETADGKATDDKKVEFAAGGNSEEVGGLMFSLRLMFDEITGNVTVTPKVDVSGYVPEAPLGWFAQDYKNADGELMTETTMSRGPIAKSSTNTLLMRFDGLARGQGNGWAKTYKRGDQMVSLILYVPDQFNRNTVRGGMMAAISQNISWSMSDFGNSPEIFALHHGVPIKEESGFVSSSSSQGDVPVDYRVFNGDVGGMFKFQVLTNSSDDAVAKILKGLPMGELIALLPEPEPHLLISTAFQTRDAEPSKEVPVSPSLARRAYLLSKTRLDFDTKTQNFLGQIIKRKVMTWEDAYPIHGTGLAIAPDVLSLLGPLPALTNAQTVEYTSRALLATKREWTDNEKRILEIMSSTYAVKELRDVDHYLKDGEVVVEDVLSLVALLPETYDAAEVSTTDTIAKSDVTAKELVIRRGTKIGQGENTFGNCSIELGVRRCVVGATENN